MIQKITSTEFVHTFCDIWKSEDRRFCFVLGAGASKSSGIRTGGELAKTWLEEIAHRMRDQTEAFQEFIDLHRISREWPGAHYPQIYRERFKLDPVSGIHYINKEMEGTRPGYGYSVLAQVLAAKHHNIIITTNFDNLTEEALYTYTQKRPLICGHELLAAFAKPSVTRPLIVKIHRDRFLNPQSMPDEIARINESWIHALNNIFQNSTPVFIGYGGNDGSLMGYLDKVSRFENIFWCERKGVTIPDKVTQLLTKHEGKLVEIEGFDELMFLLQDGLQLPLLDTEIRSIAEERAKKYQDTVKKIRNEQARSTNPEAKKAAERIVEKASDDWWSWELKAQAAKTKEEKNRTYEEALLIFPQCWELDSNYAIFLSDEMKAFDKAEIFYKKAIDLGSKDANNHGNYAVFLYEIRKDYESAERYYKKALEIDGDNGTINGNYAILLTYIRKNNDEAEKLYQKSLQSDPDNANVHCCYGNFLSDIRKNHAEAEKHYQKALELEPGNAALYLHYAKCVEAAGRTDEADIFYRKSLEIAPGDATCNAAYARFLSDVKKDKKAARPYYERSVKETPPDANHCANFSGYLYSIGAQKEAARWWRIAMNSCDDDILKTELFFYQYAHVPRQRAHALHSLKPLISLGNRSLGFNLQDNVDRAIADGHPEPELLKKLAGIITADIPANDL